MVLYMSDSSDIACSSGVWLICDRDQCWLQDAETDSTCIAAQSSGVTVLNTTLNILLLAQETRKQGSGRMQTTWACVDTVTLRARAHGCC